MRAKKILAEEIFILVCACLLCACADQEPEKRDNIRVGVTYYNQSDTFLSALLDCFRERLEGDAVDGRKLTLTVRDAAGSQKTQNDQVKELLDLGCSVLCVNLVDRADPSEIIDLAREKDVPIIFFNREPVAEDLRQWEKLYYVGADARQSGELQGELAAEFIQENSQTDRNKDGKIQYVVLEGEPGHQDAIIRTESAVDTLQKKGIRLEKLSWQIANWDRAQAQNRMMQIISQYQNSIELVLANNDAMALGALDAYEQLNYTESAVPVFFGIDGTDVGLQAVIDGKMAGTVYNDKESQAEMMARLVVDIVSGEGMEKTDKEDDKCTYFPYYKVNPDNAADFLNAKDGQTGTF